MRDYIAEQGDLPVSNRPGLSWASTLIPPAGCGRFTRTARTRIDSGAHPGFLRSPPGNRLEALQGGSAGQYSISVNDGFRLCFRWTAAGAEEVESLTTIDGELP